MYFVAVIYSFLSLFIFTAVTKEVLRDQTENNQSKLLCDKFVFVRHSSK